MHNYYVVPNLVDGAIANKQAWERLVDKRHPDESIVHQHKHLEPCTDKCRRYHTCITTNEPGSHSIAESCPVKEETTNG